MPQQTYLARASRRTSTEMNAANEVWFSSEAFLQRRGGVSRCFCEVAAALDGHPEFGWRPTIRVGLHSNLHLGDLAASRGIGRRIVRGRRFRLPGSLRRWCSRWTDRSLLATLRRRADRNRLVVHDTGHRLASIGFDAAQVVITVHDLINDEDPVYRRERAGLLREKAAAVARAARIVVPSFATRDALIRVHGVDEARIDVIHHGSRMPPPDDRDPIGLPYLLHVGSRGRYKDFATLTRAFARVRRSGFTGILVNVGGGPLRGSERSAMDELGLPAGSIRAIGADDRELATLYANAQALAVPSRIEGFGIPILEAMSLGCPVACMEAPGCAEVAGEAALLAPVEDDTALAANLARIIGDARERSRLVKAGLARADAFTWAESARKHAACYAKALG